VEKNYDNNMLSRFHLKPERHEQTDRRTDGRTDRQICYINIARHVLTGNKKYCGFRDIALRKVNVH